MQVNLTELVAQVMPWDLSFTIGGTAYATRPLVVGDLLVLQSLGRRPTAEAIAIVAGLFQDPKPDVGTWEPALLAVVPAAVVAYFQERSAGKTNALIQQAQLQATGKATAPASMSGN